MGLAASQARYIFITQRKISLEGALMINSNKQIRIAQEAAELSEEKNAALSEKQWELNGNADFDYDMLMGESAMNSENGLYMVMTAGKDSKVVLNTNYAMGMLAAGISQTGGNATDAGLAKFLAYAAGSPKNASSWEEVQNATKFVDEAQKFVNEYGATAPQNGNNPDLTQRVLKSKMSMSEILAKMGNTGNFTGITNTDGKTGVRNFFGHKYNAGSDDLYEQRGTDCSYADLVKGNSTICLINDQEALSYEETDIRARVGFTNLANKIIDDISRATGISNLREQLKSYVEEMASAIDNNQLNLSEDGDEDDARDGGREDARNGLIGYAVDDTGTDELWVYCNPSELTRRLLQATASLYHEDDYVGNANITNLQKCSTNLDYNSSVFQYGDEEHPYTNDHGKTYSEWQQAFGKLSADAQNYVKTGQLSAQASAMQADINALLKYKQIYNEACSSGWTMDENVNNKKYLTNKLENNQYVIKHDNLKNTMKNTTGFSLVKKYDKDEIEAYYETEENKLKFQEKKLTTERDRIQVELSAVQTEAQSVKALIDKNIERGFTYSYNG